MEHKNKQNLVHGQVRIKNADYKRLNHYIHIQKQNSCAESLK